ncbi:uncharacterized protein PG986_002589 [Apiospora aurea]|uniref:Ankyrin repeat protein n=1 Tax=Apiospora aurea TaxID=335848 RepID=A0ABR1QP92_9PEZI
MAYRPSATRLSQACTEGNLPRVQSFAEMQEHPSSDIHGDLNRAAYAAAVGKHAHVLRFLLENGASVTGSNSLLPAACHFARDTEILQVMHEHGWDAEQINKDMSQHPMGLPKGTKHGQRGHDAHECRRPRRTKSEAITETMDLLLSRGATLEPTVLMNVISWRNHGKFYPKVLQWLVDHGADVNCTTKTGARILKAAISKRNAALVQFLLDSGAETDHLGQEILLDDDEQECEGLRGSALEYTREIQADEICRLLESHASQTGENVE